MAEAITEEGCSATGGLEGKKDWIPVPSMSGGVVTVVEKLRNHVAYKDADMDKLQEQAEFLSDAAKMKERYFSHLLKPGRESIQEAVEEAWDLSDDSFLTQEETKDATERAQARFATVCSLPMKLVLTKIGEDGDKKSKGSTPAMMAGSKAGAIFASFHKFPFGAFHAVVMIGDVVVEWDTSSLVIPDCKQVMPTFQTSLEIFSYWSRFTNRYKSHMKRASVHRPDFNTQVDVMFIIHREKEAIIDHLIQEIIRYNTEFQYNLRKCNCQHFILDTMRTIRVFEIPNFTGRLKRYFDNLCKGKESKARKEFESHQDLDQYVHKELDRLEHQELECLLCLYTAFHRLAGMKDPTDWQCSLDDCQLSRVQGVLDSKQAMQHKFTDTM